MLYIWGGTSLWQAGGGVVRAARGGKDGGSLVMKVAITFSSAAANGASSGGGVMAAFFSTSFSMSISNLVAQIGAARLVDQLNDARLALGDLAARSVDGRNDLLVERVDQQRGQAFRTRSARVPS